MKSPMKSPVKYKEAIDDKDDHFKRVSKTGIVPLNCSDESPKLTDEEDAESREGYVPPDRLSQSIMDE